MKTLKKIIIVTLLTFQALALVSAPLVAYAAKDVRIAAAAQTDEQKKAAADKKAAAKKKAAAAKKAAKKETAKTEAEAKAAAAKKAEEDKIRREILQGCKSDFEVDKVTQCLTGDQKTAGLYTVMEESIQAPEDFQQDEEPVAGQPDERPVRTCYRFTSITECKVSGSNSVKKTEQYLLRNLADCQSKENTTEKLKQNPGASTGASTSYSECQEVTVLYTKGSGIGLLQIYLGLIYKWAAGIVGVIAVLIIVISGIQIATSQEEDKIAEAKKRIGQSVAGIALLFMISALLYVINPTFFSAPTGTEQNATDADTSGGDTTVDEEEPEDGEELTDEEMDALLDEGDLTDEEMDALLDEDAEDLTGDSPDTPNPDETQEDPGQPANNEAA